MFSCHSLWGKSRTLVWDRYNEEEFVRENPKCVQITCERTIKQIGSRFKMTCWSMHNCCDSIHQLSIRMTPHKSCYKSLHVTRNNVSHVPSLHYGPHIRAIYRTVTTNTTWRWPLGSTCFWIWYIQQDWNSCKVVKKPWCPCTPDQEEFTALLHVGDMGVNYVARTPPGRNYSTPRTKSGLKFETSGSTYTNIFLNKICSEGAAKSATVMVWVKPELVPRQAKPASFRPCDGPRLSN